MLASKERPINTNPVVVPNHRSLEHLREGHRPATLDGVEGMVEVIRAIYTAARAPWV
jgi:hypothetical protein